MSKLAVLYFSEDILVISLVSVYWMFQSIGYELDNIP